MLGHRAEPGGDQQRTELVAVQPGGVRLARSADSARTVTGLPIKVNVPGSSDSGWRTVAGAWPVMMTS